MSRKLASIRRVAEVLPIEGADNIEIVMVDGWQMITQKSNGFKPGSLVVFFEIDSFLPIRPEFEFLRKSGFRSTTNLGDGFRLRTMKLRGVVSQGLVLPVDSIPEFNEWCWQSVADAVDVDGAYDVTSTLGVQLYEKPIPAQLAGRVRGNFPMFIRKTDQERIQNVTMRTLERHSDDEFEVTLKLDGSSFTTYHNLGQVGVCSRNWDLDINDPENAGNSFIRVEAKYHLLERLAATGLNVAIQGELMGPGVQHNREGLLDLDLYVFDVYDIDQQKYMSVADRRYFLMTYFPDLKWAPAYDNYKFPRNRLSWTEVKKQLLEMAEGPSLNNQVREGLVFKSLDGQFSFKAISNTFLLKEKD